MFWLLATMNLDIVIFAQTNIWQPLVANNLTETSHMLCPVSIVVRFSIGVLRTQSYGLYVEKCDIDIYMFLDS